MNRHSISYLILLALFAAGCASLDQALLPRERGARIYDQEALDAIRYLEERWHQEPVPVGVQRQVFYDDALVAERTEGVVRKLGNVEKLNDGHAVMDMETWETHEKGFKGSMFYFSVLHEEGLFRMWYEYGDAGTGTRYMGLAESADGLNWEKRHSRYWRPTLKTPVHGICVMRDPRERRPWHRYKMVYGWGTGFGRTGRDAGLTFAYSRTGRFWRDYGEPHPIDEVRSDTANALMWDEEIERYRLSTRLQDLPRGYIQLVRPYISPGILRTVGHALFLPTASPWQKVDSYRLPYTRRHQIYALYVQKYESIYIAYVNVHEDNQNRFYVAFSRSGTDWDWHWIQEGERFIPPGPPGSFDHYGQFHASSPMITQDGRHLIFYNGHGVGRGEARRMVRIDEDRPVWGPGIAAVRLDGFAYLENEYDVGHIATKSFIVNGRALTVNADADRPGEGVDTLLRVEITDPEGRPLEGFTAEDADPIRNDGLHLPVTWNSSSDLSALMGREVRLVFHLQGPVRLYAFQVMRSG